MKEDKHKKINKQQELKEETIKTDVVELEKYLALETMCKQALADYQNLKKRSSAEKELIIKFSNEVLIGKLLDVFIGLGLASEHLKDNGLDGVYAKFLSVLKSEGLEIIDPIGEDFNSHEHEGVEILPGENGKVIKVLQKGFKLNNKVLKPAVVAVGNGN